tara:strand:- start:905 stop:1327 length:423 start_codon:yes stop_codon:yes gene_type:complete
MILLLLLLIAAPAAAVPVVPSFNQGSLSSTTTTKTKINEVINSYEYRTGYEMTVSGTNIAPKNGELTPRALTNITNDVNGITSTWTGLDPSDRPSWSIVNEGGSFQLLETFNGPGLVNHTIINRTTDIESVNETISTFTQ